jgi:hypothetical protein
MRKIKVNGFDFKDTNYSVHMNKEKKMKEMLSKIALKLKEQSNFWDRILKFLC